MRFAAARWIARPRWIAGLAGLLACGAVGSLTSTGWLQAGYARATTTSVAAAPLDEHYWLSRTPSRAAPASLLATADGGTAGRSTTFAVGGKLVLSGPSRLTLEVISVTPADPSSGLVDGQGRPLLVVTAREKNGVRLVRMMVEADREPGAGEQSL